MITAVRLFGRTIFSRFFLHDMLRWTNHNIMGILGRFPKELLMFLDPSIEYLRGNVNDKQADIQLKFYGKEEIFRLHLLL